MRTAVAAVKDVLPDATVETVCKDDYPITVSILDEDGNTIYTTSQRNLFRKYASQRTKAIAEIHAALKKHYDV